MNRNLRSFLSSILVCFTLILAAQVDLPYYSGFDNAAERAGWQIFRTGENALANWSNPSVGGFSPTSCISHDYAPSTGASVADDWYVSPGFLIPLGGGIDSVRYFFSGFSVPADDDTIGIFLLTGSPNPASATSITLLVDFRGSLYQPDATYRLLNGIYLSATQEMAYIAFRYRNAQVSSTWLTVQFDNIAISDLSTSVNPPTTDLILSVYPNPCTEVLTIQHSEDAGMLVLHDYMGRAIQHTQIIQGQSQTSLPVRHLAGGFYYVTIMQAGQILSRGFMKRM
jgi:hypothetical protein